MNLIKDIRSLLVSLLIFFALAILGEFIAGPMFGDDIPLWKILAVSFITAIMTVIPLQKRGLSTGDIFKYFRRKYFYPQAQLGALYTQLLEVFPERYFRLKLNEKEHRIRISRKANWRSFGEVINLKAAESQVLVQVRPKFYLDIFDQGQALESLNRIEQVLQKEIQANA